MPASTYSKYINKFIKAIVFGHINEAQFEALMIS